MIVPILLGREGASGFPGQDVFPGLSQPLVTNPWIAIVTFLLDHPEIIDDDVVTVAAGRKMPVGAAQTQGFGWPPCPANFQLFRVPDGVDPVALVRAPANRGSPIQSGVSAPGLRTCVRVTLDGPAIAGRFLGALALAGPGSPFPGPANS